MTADRQNKKVELLGKELRRLRKERKLSVAQVAEHAGLDAQDLARIERGETRIGLETLFRLLSAFDVEAHELKSLVCAGGSSFEAGERFRRELSR